MNSYFDGLVARVLDDTLDVQPRVASRFELPRLSETLARSPKDAVEMRAERRDTPRDVEDTRVDVPEDQSSVRGIPADKKVRSQGPANPDGQMPETQVQDWPEAKRSHTQSPEKPSSGDQLTQNLKRDSDTPADRLIEHGLDPAPKPPATTRPDGSTEKSGDTPGLTWPTPEGSDSVTDKSRDEVWPRADAAGQASPQSGPRKTRDQAKSGTTSGPVGHSLVEGGQFVNRRDVGISTSAPARTSLELDRHTEGHGAAKDGTSRPPPGTIKPQVRPSRRAHSSPEPPPVNISIGLIEVRAVTPPPPAAAPVARPRPAPALSLEDYLKQRDGTGS